MTMTTKTSLRRKGPRFFTKSVFFSKVPLKLIAALVLLCLQFALANCSQSSSGGKESPPPFAGGGTGPGNTLQSVGGEALLGTWLEESPYVEDEQVTINLEMLIEKSFITMTSHCQFTNGSKTSAKAKVSAIINPDRQNIQITSDDEQIMAINEKECVAALHQEQWNYSLTGTGSGSSLRIVDQNGDERLFIRQ